MRVPFVRHTAVLRVFGARPRAEEIVQDISAHGGAAVSAGQTAHGSQMKEIIFFLIPVRDGLKESLLAAEASQLIAHGIITLDVAHQVEHVPTQLRLAFLHGAPIGEMASDTLIFGADGRRAV